VNIGCGCRDLIALGSVVLAEQPLTGSRAKNGVHPTGCCPQMARQRRKVTYRGTGPASDTDSMLGRVNRSPHPVPATLYRPPTRRGERRRSDQTPPTQGATVMQPRDPDPPQPFPSGAKAAPHTPDGSNRQDSRR
jgi:hypothetical protein